MPFLIDGDNLLGTWKRERSDDERRSLAMTIARLASRTDKRMLCVFDGSPDPAVGAFGNSARFSGRGKTADDVILELLERQADRRGWVVITDDRPLGDRSRWLGARVERCNVFRQRLVEDDDDGKPETPQTEAELEYWLEQFDR